MEIRKEKKDSALSMAIEGRIDTTTAPQLETELKTDLDGVTELRLDFGPVEYISSAGLRVLLSAQKLMNRQGKMVLTHVSESVMEIFEVTGFSDILTIGRRTALPLGCSVDCGSLPCSRRSAGR